MKILHNMISDLLVITNTITICKLLYITIKIEYYLMFKVTDLLIINIIYEKNGEMVMMKCKYTKKLFIFKIFCLYFLKFWIGCLKYRGSLKVSKRCLLSAI